MTAVWPSKALKVLYGQNPHPGTMNGSPAIWGGSRGTVAAVMGMGQGF